MGNQQQKLISQTDTLEILGVESYRSIRMRLSKYGAKAVDITMFSNIVRSRFERIPTALVESLYQAFAGNLTSRIDIDHFISGIAVLLSDNSLLIKRLLFHVYKNNYNTISRRQLEELLLLAYGNKLRSNPDILKDCIYALFGQNKRELTQQELEQFTGPIDILLKWILKVMRIFLEPNYPKLYSLEKKYSSHLEAEQAITRYGINRVTCDNLRTLFYSKCSTNSYSMKSELLLETWIEWVNSYIHKDLATIIFKAKIDNFKPIWRFIDFVDFCVLFGSQNIETIATQLCKKFIESILFHRNLHSNSTNHGSYDNGSNQYNNSGNEDADSRNYSHSGDFLDYDGHEVTTESENNIEEDLRIGLRTMIQSLSLSTDHSGACYKTRSNSQVDNQSSQRSPNTTENSNQETIPISEIEQAEKAGIDGLTQFYANFIVTYEYELPGLLDLRLTACCLFSIPPPTPLLEKIFVTELTVRHIHTYPQTSTQPHGPVGTEWCVVWRPWYDAWRVYVGNHSKYVQKNNKDEPGDSPRLNSSSKSGNSRALKPLMIDNWNILRRTAARQLLPDVTLGQDIDILPPAVYFALHSWYGGGPRILRRVVPLLSPTTTPKVLSDASTASVSTINFSEVTELELYPLCVRVCLCDSNGKELPIERELLFSKTCTVQEMTSDLSRFRRIDESKVRLWNYADSDWKQQHVLPPDLNLIEAKIQDGQTIMMEISLMDGTWPRSQLHARLVVTGSNGSEEAEDEEDSSVSTSQDYILKHRAVGQKDTKEGIPKTQRRLNNGLVGLDNLGNTCYLNSSLQALVHTELLADYFLSKMYLKDINVKNIHGFKGRLAISFGKIVHDLWTTKQKELSPKNFLYDVASLRDQFAGNEQHDAHELLVFVIDGLSEDLNLVYKKPYTENPDSDGRPDEILANIWWENHLKRDRSIIQALFTGQYKSIMKCECGYSSARYEPFNFLTVPIPEETLRVFYVIVIPLQVEYSTKVAVKVNKTMGMVCDIIKEVILLDLPGTQRSATKDVESLPSTSNTEDNFIKPEDNRYKDVFFICGELLDSRIRSFNAMDRRVDTIKDNESIILFQVRRVPDELSIRVPHNRSIDSKLSDVKDLTSDSSNSIEENSKRAEEKELIESSEPPTNFRRISNSYFNDFLYRFTTYNHLVRVAFSQRRAKLVDGHMLGTAGYDTFVLEAYGLPILEVLPNKMRAGDLYNLVLLRLKPFLRGSVKELIGHHRKTLQSKNQLSSTSLQSMSNTNLETLSNNNANITTSTTINEINPNDHKIRMGNTDDVIGGEVIPSKGFTLRLINGGSGSSGSSCSNCSWLSRCQGCIIPDSDYCSIDLRDGESIAIDWHFVVFEDLLDTIAATNITKHESIIRENNIHNDTRIPLSKCLDKFTEEEKLEGIVCPKCKSDDKLTRSFSIWRHPGILIIQIKRFQFDRTSRKKLTQRIDFPIDNFDILRYLVKYQNNCAVSNSNTDSDVKSLALDDINLNLTTAEHSAIDRECSEYDLYSVIHHVGALGGGHYVTTVRQPTSKSDRDKAPATTNNTSNAEKSGDDNENKDKWYCFNDNIMNEVKDITEITSPSAYVLFYVRKDMKQKSINEVLSHFYLEHLGKESVPTTASSTAPAPLAHDDMKNKKPRNGIMKTANNSNMSINVPAVNITMNDANTSNSGAITPTNSKRVTFDKSPEVSSHRKIPADRPNATVISGNIAEAEAMGIEEGDREASEGCNIQ